MNKYKKITFLGISALFLVSIFLLLPIVRVLIIKMGEVVLRRALNHSRWNIKIQLTGLELLVFDIISFLYALLFFYHDKLNIKANVLTRISIVITLVFLILSQPSLSVQVEKHTTGIISQSTIKIIFFAIRWIFVYFLLFLCYLQKESVEKYITRPIIDNSKNILSKRNKHLFWEMFAFLLFCYFAIIIALSGQSTWDTERLFLYGMTDGFHIQGRFLAEKLLDLFHLSTVIYNTTPLMQMIGIVELAIISIVLSYIYTVNIHNGQKAISKFTLLASLPAVLSPWFTKNMGYVHDSSFHPLAMLFGIIPFIFTENTVTFIVVSLISNYLMCLTYQLASGVYIVMTLYYALYQYLAAKKSFKQSFIFILIAAASYLVALGFYEFGVFYAHPWNGYATATMPSLTKIPAILMSNIKTYVNYIITDLGKTPLQCVYIFITLAGLLTSILYSKRSKLISCAISIFVFITALILSFGVSLILERPLWDARAFIGIGVFMSLQMYSFICARDILSVRNLYTKYIVPFVAILCSYALIVFAYTFGAAQYQQKLYVTSYMNAITQDLNSFSENASEMQISCEGGIDIAPTALLSCKRYPLLRRMLHTRLFDSSAQFLIKQRGFARNMMYGQDFKFDEMQLLKDTQMYTIYGDGIHFKIVLHSLSN